MKILNNRLSRVVCGARFVYLEADIEKYKDASAEQIRAQFANGVPAIEQKIDIIKNKVDSVLNADSTYVITPEEFQGFEGDPTKTKVCGKYSVEEVDSLGIDAFITAHPDVVTYATDNLGYDTDFDEYPDLVKILKRHIDLTRTYANVANIDKNIINNKKDIAVNNSNANRYKTEGDKYKTEGDRLAKQRIEDLKKKKDKPTE